MGLAAIEIDVDLADGADRAAFVRALANAIRTAAEPFRGSPSRATDPAGPGAMRYRTHLVIYPAPDELSAAADGQRAG